MKRNLFFNVIVLTLLLTGCSQLAASPTLTRTIMTEELGTIDEAVDQQIKVLIEQGDIPSLSVGIVLNDELVWSKNYDGLAGLDSVYIASPYLLFNVNILCPIAIQSTRSARCPSPIRIRDPLLSAYRCVPGQRRW